MADIVCTTLLARIHLIHQRKMFTPKVAEYYDRVKARASFNEAQIMDHFPEHMNQKIATIKRRLLFGFGTICAVAGGYLAYQNQDKIKEVVEQYT